MIWTRATPQSRQERRGNSGERARAKIPGTQKTNDEGRCVGKGVAGGQSERERNKGGWDTLPASVEDIGCVDDECRAHALW